MNFADLLESRFNIVIQFGSLSEGRGDRKLARFDFQNWRGLRREQFRIFYKIVDAQSGRHYDELERVASFAT